MRNFNNIFFFPLFYLCPLGKSCCLFLPLLITRGKQTWLGEEAKENSWSKLHECICPTWLVSHHHAFPLKWVRNGVRFFPIGPNNILLPPPSSKFSIPPLLFSKFLLTYLALSCSLYILAPVSRAPRTGFHTKKRGLRTGSYFLCGERMEGVKRGQLPWPFSSA